MAALADNLLLAPEGSFYRRHSPRHELPLAFAISIFVHGFVVGLLILLIVFSFFGSNSESIKPPTMDAIMVEGGMGAGAGGFNLAAGLPGEPKTEVAKNENFKVTTTTANKVAPPPEPENLLSTQLSPSDPTEIFKDLENIVKDAEKDAKKPDPEKKDLKKTVASTKPPGQRGQGGDGNGGNGEGGSGKTPGVGKGGKGGVAGRDMTRQEVFAARWRFDLSGSPKEHINKLVAARMILAVPDQRGNVNIIQDLQRRPIDMKRESVNQFFERYKNTVTWENKQAQSVQGLGRELRLGFDPFVIYMMLPKDREEQMAAEEARFARSQGREPQQVRETWFDFVLQDGVYEPRAIKQN